MINKKISGKAEGKLIASLVKKNFQNKFIFTEQYSKNFLKYLYFNKWYKRYFLTMAQ